MKEFIDKLISRLEELKKIEKDRPDDCDEEGYGDAEQIYDDGRSQGRYEQTNKIIQIVNELAEEYKDAEVLNMAQISADYAKARLEELKRISNNGWIPCSERLPSREEYQKCNGQFIVSDGNRTYATYFDIYDTLKFGEPTMDKFKVDKCVITWMPLPAPYTEGE